jgi:hypothetical protein
MKLFTAVVLSMLVGGVANAHQKSTKSIGAIVVDRSGNALDDVVQVPAEIGEFAQQNDCYDGGQNARCIYQLPINGIVKPVFISVGNVTGEAVLLVTEVPGRMLDSAATYFEACEANPRNNVEKTTCSAIAWTFDQTGHLVYVVGYYTADSIDMTFRTGGYALEMTGSSLDNLTRGHGNAAMNDLATVVVGAPACLAASVLKAGFELIFTGRPSGIDCEAELKKKRAGIN